MENIPTNNEQPAEASALYESERKNQEHSEEQQANKYQEEINSDTANIETLKAALANAPEPELEKAPSGNAFVAHREEKPKHHSRWKNLLRAIGISAVGLLPAKEAMSQQAKHINNPEVKKEVTAEAPKEFHQLSQEEMDAWEGYVDYAISHGLDKDERMKTKSFADKMLNEYIAHHPGTPLSVAKVAQIQQQFIEYRKWVLEKVKHSRPTDTERYEIADGGTPENFMQHLSANDQIAGPNTLRKFPHAFMTFSRDMIMKGNVQGKDVAYVINTDKSPTIDTGFQDMNK